MMKKQVMKLFKSNYIVNIGTNKDVVNDRAKEPLVSIIIPCFNSRKTIQKTIESVLRNSYKNYEIVVVDDGSDIPILDILESFNNTRINYFKKENQGPGLARNFGIKHARGEYVFFLDADDELFPKGLCHLMEFALENKLSVVSGITVRNYLETGRREQWFPSIYKTKAINDLRDRNGLYNDTLSTNKIYKKNFLLDNNILFEKGLYEDKLFTAKLYSFIDHIGLIDEEVYLWHVYGSNTSITQTKNIKNFEERMIAIEKLWSYLPELRKMYQIAYFTNHDLLIYLREFKFYNSSEQRYIFDLSSPFVVKHQKYFYERLIPNSMNWICMDALRKGSFEDFSRFSLILSLEYYSSQI